MKFAARQQHLADCLSANAYFTGVEIILENDPAGTPADHVAEEKRFEQALATKGLVLVVLSPFTARLDQIKRGGIAVRVHLPIAITENIEVNRGAAGHGKPALEVLEEAIRTLLPFYEFNDRPFGRPEMGNGLTLYYLMAETTHRILAAPAGA